MSPRREVRMIDALRPSVKAHPDGARRQKVRQLPTSDLVHLALSAGLC